MSGPGYGRGYFGSEQLDRARQERSGVGWFKVLAAAGLGAAVWFFWPRKGDGTPSTAETPPAPLSDETLGHVARARGFSSAKAYEDALIASAQELRATDAKVEFPPYFQYLEKRVGMP